ncbi:MAG: hypothetical protein ACT4PT_03230 [Methanobacteriota archaeon]
MPYAWNWFGAANLLASVLLLVLGVLFLRARRSEFTVAFSAYSLLAAAQKFTGGVAYYLADEATRPPWLLASTLFLLASTPTVAHALAAFTWGPRFRGLRAGRKVLLYVPFAAFAPFLATGRVGSSEGAFLLAIVFMALLLVFFVAVFGKARRAATSIERTQCRYVLSYLAIAFAFSAEARVLLALTGRMPWWEVSIAYMVATGILLYGIAKTHLFDIDVRVKWTIHRGTLAGIFVAVFFVVSEFAKSFFAARAGLIAGVLAAGALLFVLSPLQRVAERVADAAMPGVRPVGALSGPERTEAYRELVRFVWADGRIDRDERRMLAAMRERLGLSATEAERIELDATGG